MIDIHSHILPGIDDGAKTIEDSLMMAKKAVEEGITTILATPHHMNGSYENRKQEIVQAVELLNDRLKEEQIPLTVAPGQEVRIYGECLQDYEKGEIVTIPSHNGYLLLELPSNHVPRYTNQLLYDIQVMGLTPIIVHPERNSELIEVPDMLYNIVKSGTLTQITASSLTGHFGKKIKKFTEQLIEHNLTHFIASDAHNTTNRGFNMQQAFTELERKFGQGKTYEYKENAELLLQGKHIHNNQPERVKRKKILGIF